MLGTGGIAMRRQMRHRVTAALGGILLLFTLVAAVLVATGAVNMTSAERPEHYMDIGARVCSDPTAL